MKFNDRDSLFTGAEPTPESLTDRWEGIYRWSKTVVHSCTKLPPSTFANLKDDLYQEALVAVSQGLETFDPSLGVPLRSYLKQKISNAVHNYLRALDPLPRSMRTHARMIAQTREQLCQDNRCDPSIHDIADHSGIPAARVAFILRHEESPHPRPHPENVPLVTESGDDPALQVETTEQRLALRDALFALPQRQRQVVTWRYLHGFTVKQIAERLDISPGAVSRLCARGVHNVRSRLLEQEWMTQPVATKVGR